MNKELLLTTIEKILLLIENHEKVKPNHARGCLFLKEKYLEIKKAIIKEDASLQELLEWNRLFAPRIIFDGIGDEKLIQIIQQLNNES